MGTKEFDVFLSYNSSDTEQVEQLSRKLKDKGLQVFFDRWELRPGFSAQDALSSALGKSKSIVVVVGPKGVGPWQKLEIEDAIREQVISSRPVIPGLLRGVSPENLPLFLRGQHRIDFAARPEAEEFERLLWGITGVAPSAPSPSPPPCRGAARSNAP